MSATNITIRELQKANARLVSALRRRARARRALTLAERDVKAARILVRQLIESTTVPDPSTMACDACKSPLGHGAKCLECAVVRSFVDGSVTGSPSS